MIVKFEIQERITEKQIEQLKKNESEIYLDNPWQRWQPLPIKIKDILSQSIFDYGVDSAIARRIVDLLSLYIINNHDQSVKNELGYAYFGKPVNYPIEKTREKI